MRSIVWFAIGSLGASVVQAQDRKLERALEESRVAFAGRDVPLAEVASSFATAASVSVVVDDRVLAGADLRLTLELPDAPLREALERAFSPVGLVWGERCGAIVVSTAEGLARFPAQPPGVSPEASQEDRDLAARLDADGMRLECEKLPLDEVLEFLGSAREISFALHPAIDASERRVSVELRPDLSIGQELALLLAQVDLEARIARGVVRIQPLPDPLAGPEKCAWCRSSREGERRHCCVCGFPEAVRSQDSRHFEPRVARAMDVPIHFEAAGIPLIDVLGVLSESAQIDIVCDPPSLEDVLVSLRVRALSVESVLDLIEFERGIAWKPSCGAIVVSTPGGIGRFPDAEPTTPEWASDELRAVYERLDQPMPRLEFEVHPVGEVVEFLRDNFELPIAIEAPVEGRVTMRLSDTTVGRILALAAPLVGARLEILPDGVHLVAVSGPARDAQCPTCQTVEIEALDRYCGDCGGRLRP